MRGRTAGVPGSEETGREKARTGSGRRSGTAGVAAGAEDRDGNERRAAAAAPDRRMRMAAGIMERGVNIVHPPWEDKPKAPPGNGRV